MTVTHTEPGPADTICPRCQGLGETITNLTSDPTNDEPHTCGWCAGRGWVTGISAGEWSPSADCEACRGDHCRWCDPDLTDAPTPAWVTDLLPERTDR